jgi:AraC-like DNA-binding protein
MIFNFEEKPSDSPFVEVVWRNHSESGGNFISMASSHWQMVITKHNGKTKLTVRGPETKATPAYCPPGAEHFGIYFKHGVVMPNLPAIHLRDGNLDLPEARSDSFWLNGSTWQFPDYENADVFVDRLVRDELLTREPAVDVASRIDLPVLSVRSVQRRFLKATGLTRGTLSQIDRARYATGLLQQGVSILDTVDLAGYSDQPHLTRSLKYFVGRTPAQLIRKDETSQLSFLSRMYKIPED